MKNTAIIRLLDAVPDRLFLNDDWDLAVPEDNIHLIEGDAVYLLAETHGSGVRNAEVAQCGQIAKISEVITAIAEDGAQSSWERGQKTLAMDSTQRTCSTHASAWRIC